PILPRPPSRHRATSQGRPDSSFFALRHPSRSKFFVSVQFHLTPTPSRTILNRFKQFRIHGLNRFKDRSQTMIPASYLFKDVFQQSFYDPDIAEAATRHRRMQTGRHIFSWLDRKSTRLNSSHVKISYA